MEGAEGLNTAKIAAMQQHGEGGGGDDVITKGIIQLFPIKADNMNLMDAASGNLTQVFQALQESTKLPGISAVFMGKTPWGGVLGIGKIFGQQAQANLNASSEEILGHDEPQQPMPETSSQEDMHDAGQQMMHEGANMQQQDMHHPEQQQHVSPPQQTPDAFEHEQRVSHERQAAMQRTRDF